MTHERRAEIEAMLAAITSGEWRVFPKHDYVVYHPGADGEYQQSVAMMNMIAEPPLPYRENAAFIAAAPAIIRELLDALGSTVPNPGPNE